jgi:predicted CoA-binding protein
MNNLQTHHDDSMALGTRRFWPIFCPFQAKNAPFSRKNPGFSPSTLSLQIRWNAMNDPAVIDEMLQTAKTIAVVGMSEKTWRSSNRIGEYLAANGYRVLPVNPALKQVLGMPSYPDLDAAQAAAKEQNASGIDLVDVFRAPQYVPAIVDDVIRLGISYLWLQDDVMHEEAVARARVAGVKCIENDCIFREHAARADSQSGR